MNTAAAQLSTTPTTPNPRLVIRRAEERGHANYGWLDTHHTFSFAGYHDPRHMGFGALRVINDDRVGAGAGFGTHPHRDMEIISYVVEGALEHKDSMGNGSIIRPGEVQRMTAGTGVRHSEYNPSRGEGARFLQIWIIPERRGLTPSYEQRAFDDERRGRLRLVVSPDGREGSLRVHQDAALYASLLTAGEGLEHEPAPGKRVWIQVVRGRLQVDGHTLREGDGASVEPARPTDVLAPLRFDAEEDSEFLVFELA